MKVIIEMDALEAEKAISNGALASILNSASKELKTFDIKDDNKAIPVTPIQQQVIAPAIENAIPVTTPANAPTAVPTEVTGYTLEQLAKAGAQVVDMGKRDAVLAVLNEFGISALSELQKDQYGAYATKLRGLGAKI